MSKLICCKITDKHFGFIRYVIITWTFIVATALIISAFFSEMVAYEWIEFSMSKVNFSATHPAMKIVKNINTNKTYYEYDSKSNKRFEKAMTSQSFRDAYQHALAVVVIINCVIGGIFHLFGLIGSWRSVHCLVLTFGIYMTFATVMLFINSLTNNYYELIVAFICAFITSLSYCLCSGIRERWFRAVGVGVIDDRHTNQTTIVSDEMKTERIYKLYPDLSNDIFNIVSPGGCVQPLPVIPSAPPLPHNSQFSDFSKF